MDANMLLIIVSLTCLHICTGPDHYLPFIALSKSRNWPVGKTIFWTTLCGIGHIASSVIISTVVMALGWGILKISWLDKVRGNVAGWALLLLGLCYMLWGFWQLKQNKPHKHFEANDDGNMYVFEHEHGGAIAPKQKHLVTPWVMFVIFALAPNEPIIPLLSVLGIGGNFWSVVGFVAVYIVATISAMLLMVLLGYYGLSFFKIAWLEKYVQLISGLTLLLCGAAMLFIK